MVCFFVTLVLKVLTNMKKEAEVSSITIILAQSPTPGAYEILC
jgi:hypothetical protein